MKCPRPVTVDCETFAIEGRPNYPPIPIGVSIQWPGEKPRYYGFGHLTNNTASREEAHDAIQKAYMHPDGVLFQNGKFDVDVIEVHFDLVIHEWHRIHDTMFLLFLHDPNQTELGLKPSSERLLGMKPEERDAVADWLIAHQPVPNVKISASKGSDHYFMKYLAFAPGDLVGTYANGDTIRTSKLFKFLWPDIQKRNMLKAYDRERKLMPILLGMERSGVPVDTDQLRKDVKTYSQWFTKVEQWICRYLGTTMDALNLDSGNQLMKALIASGKVNEKDVPRTKPSKHHPLGKYQTNKEALLIVIKDRVLLGMLKYRTQLKTCLGTFMKPWLETAEQSAGLIFTQWNQIKSTHGDGNIGTRTGRLSSTPNFQNMAKEFNPIFLHEDKKNTELPPCPLRGLPSLPLIRSYIIPFEGHTFVDRDYSQQEPRILAHFDGGALMRKYLENPWIDFHDYAKDELALMGLFYTRKPVKNTNLGLIYGMGVGKLAVKNNMAVDEASTLKKAILKLYPGLKEMYAEMKVRAREKQPIRTWGDREYYCEEPKLIDGRIQEYDYKMVNCLIQGSAADCTKEAIIQFDDERKRLKRWEWKLILNVHDQLTVSVPIAHTVQSMDVLKTAMEGVQFDVPMLTEGSTSQTNWHKLIDYDKKGVLCHLNKK